MYAQLVLQNIHAVENDKVEYAVAVRVKAYPNDVYSVRLYVGVMDRL